MIVIFYNIYFFKLSNVMIYFYPKIWFIKVKLRPQSIIGLYVQEK